MLMLLVSWVACVLTLAGLWGKTQSTSKVWNSLLFAANALWTVWGVCALNYPLAVMSAVLTIVSLRSVWSGANDFEDKVINTVENDVKKL